jgi:polysaccharide deacetylase family protein (PEP-CTERM system associated)
LLNILTFDVEDWFHILDHWGVEDSGSWAQHPSRVVKNTQRILDVLDEHALKATFFCLGWVAECYPDLIRDILNRGHELGSHSYCHKLAYKQSCKDFQEDLLRSISILEDISGKKITAYRAPGFSVTQENPWVFDVLIEAGIEYDCSIFPARHAHGGFHGMPATPFILERDRGEIKAFPMNTFHVAGRDVVFSGGGYFRLLNYQIIRQMMLRSDYVMTYFHPRDFDAEQPMILGLGMARRIKSYIGLKGAMSKLERLLAEFDFLNLTTADGKLMDENIPRIKVGYLDMK